MFRDIIIDLDLWLESGNLVMTHADGDYDYDANIDVEDGIMIFTYEYQCISSS